MSSMLSGFTPAAAQSGATELVQLRQATLRLERHLQSGDASIVQLGLQQFSRVFDRLSPATQAEVLARGSGSLAEFAKWRALPREQRQSPVDVRVAAHRAQTGLPPGVAQASHQAFLCHGEAKSYHLFSAAKAVLSDTNSFQNPEVAKFVRALAARLGRCGEKRGQELLLEALSSRGKSPAPKRYFEAKLSALAKNAGQAVVNFGKTSVERTTNAAGEPVVRVNGAELGEAQWAQIEAARDRTLQLYESALAKPSLQGKPIGSLKQLRGFLTLGRSELERMSLFADKRALYQQRVALREKLSELRSSGKKVLIYLEGHDAAGKSSSAEGLLTELAAAGFAITTKSFKAPTAEERKQHWLQRFSDSVEQNAGVMVWDRGPAGNWAYGPAGDAELAELEAFERDLQAKGDTLMFKVNVRAEPERQAATFGKRWARALIAQELLLDPSLSSEARAGLQSILETTLSPNDLPAFANFPEIDRRFTSFVEKNVNGIAWHRIDTTSRSIAREQTLTAFSDAVAHFLE